MFDMPTKDVLAFSYWILYVLESSTNKVEGRVTDQFNNITHVPGISGEKDLELLRSLRNILVHDPTNSAELYKYLKRKGTLVDRLCKCCDFLSIAYEVSAVQNGVDVMREFHKVNKEVRW